MFGRSLVALALLLTCIAPDIGAAGQLPPDTTALEGTPTSRVESTADRTTREQLSSQQATPLQLRIRVENGQFFWASRKDQPLSLTRAGEFTYLVSNEPGHYVRFRRVNDRLSYVEHLETPLGSVTYWGELRVVLGNKRPAK